MKRILILLSSILVMFACSKEQTSTEQKEKEKAVAVTGDCSSVSANTATVSGWCNQAEQPGLSAVYGIEYSATDLTKDAKSAEATSKDADNKFSCLLTGLSSDTKYYYRTYVLFNAVRSYGEVKNFTTLKIQASITAESSNVKYSTATISGKLTVASEGTFTKSAYLYHSSTASTLDALKSSGTKQTITLNSDGTYSVVASGLKVNVKNYYCVVAKVDDAEFTTSVKNLTTISFPEPQSVNLGLSVKWASFNIGASKPEEYGHYFAWGDVTGQSWNGSSWSGSGFSSYPTYEVDSNNNLKPAYDAARVILGGSWRMPTKAEFDELKNNCTRTWTTNYNGTGVAGRIFTSKKTDYTDKSIFLPAAGYGDDSYLRNAGSYGYYWSSTFYYGLYAWYLYFLSSAVNTDDYDHNRGQSVRPVTE